MRIKKVLLINSPIDEEGKREEAANNRCFPPLGLLAIATRLRQTFKDIEVKIIDGDLVGIEKIKNIIQSFDFQIVGISVLTPTYKSALKIANYAKKIGIPYVVFGNDHASFFPELILKKRQDISFIIKGDNGDIDFTNFVFAIKNELDPFSVVNNLYGRQNGALKFSLHKNYCLRDKLSNLEYYPDIDLLDNYNIYEENYNKKFGKFHKRHIKPFIINNAKGCNKFSNRCLYCCIFELKKQYGFDAYFWKAIENYNKKYGINFLFEVCDNFGSFKKYRKQLIESMPSWFDNSEIELMVYIDANTICKDKEIIEDLKRLHIRRVNIGLDAGDNKSLLILKGIKNGVSINKKSIDKLTSAGIQIHCSFVLGCIYETYESIENTEKFIDELINNTAIVTIEVSQFFPLPCSPAWNIFIGQQENFHNIMKKYDLKQQNLESLWKESRKIFFNNDIIDLDLASKLWIDNLTFVKYNDLMNIILKINEKIEKGGKIKGGFV